MGQVTVDKVSIESHVTAKSLLKSILDQEELEVTFIADGGNGAIVDLSLFPALTHPMIDTRDMFLSDEIQKRLERMDLRIEEIE